MFYIIKYYLIYPLVLMDLRIDNEKKLHCYNFFAENKKFAYERFFITAKPQRSPTDGKPMQSQKRPEVTLIS